MPDSFLTVIDLQLKRFLLIYIPLNLVGNNLLFFLVEAFRSKEFKLKNFVLGEYLCQMWSCSKIVRIADEVSPYV